MWLHSPPVPYILFLIWICHLCLKLKKCVKHVEKNICETGTQRGPHLAPRIYMYISVYITTLVLGANKATSFAKN